MINNIIKNKISLIFILIALSQIYYLQDAKINLQNPIDIYTAGLFNMYDKGILVFIFLLSIYLMISDYEKNIVILRYNNLNLWVKDLYFQTMKKSVLNILIINILPTFYALTQINITSKECAVIFMYIVNQVASFSILIFIYILLFVINYNKVYNFVGIFGALYIPKFLLDALRRNYFTPVNMLFFNSNTPIANMLIQINVMILVFGISAYFIHNGIFKNKYKDIIWRF